MAARPGGSRAVESFLRNFEGEKRHYAQVLEVALVYGVFCLAQNFSLRSISLAELLVVTDYDKIKKRDYFVRKGVQRPAQQVQDEAEAAVRHLLRAKPSHKWRDGAAKEVDDEFASHLPANGLNDTVGGEEQEAAMPPRSTVATVVEQDKPVDAIDLYSRVLGKHFMDTAWAVFAGRKSSKIADQLALDELCVRIDQRKKPQAFPPVELPIASFSEFLDVYIALCVSRSQTQREEAVSQDDVIDTETGTKARDGSQALVVSQQHLATDDAQVPFVGMKANKNREHVQSTSRHIVNSVAGRPKGSNSVSKPSRVPRTVPKHLQHVQSKIQPELSARRDKVLRVKKTQTQLMKESLARTRLAEYEARKNLEDIRDRAILKKRAPLGDITQGAAALEIVDTFVRSPLMDTFGKENTSSPALNVAQAIGKPIDPVQEELYGAVALDESFVGVKMPKAHRTEGLPKRAFNGWLGDYGPAHTKTVRHQWSDSEDSADELDGKRSPPRFEWNFDDITASSGGQHDKPRVSSASSRSKAVRALDDSFRSGSPINDRDRLSESSNSVYEWLKEAV